MNQVKYKIFRLGVFILFLNSMYPWIMWSWKIPLAAIIAFCAAIPLVSHQKFTQKSKGLNSLLKFVLLLMLAWFSRTLTIFGIIGQVFLLFPAIVLIDINKELKVDIIRFVTKWFAVLLAVSLFFFILMNIGLGLPHAPLEMAGYSYVHENYYFFVINPATFRFNSVFLEPGHMTMGLAPLLFINRYNIKNPYVLILFIAQLFSMSLAGIIVMLAGLIMLCFSPRSSKKALTTLISVFFVLSFSVICMTKILGAEDLIQVAVIDRLENSEDAMEKRTDIYTSILFDKYLQSDSLLYGMPELKQKIDGAGYKMFLIVNGFIGLFIVVLFYFIPVLIYKNREVFFFFILIMMLFAQDAYPQWFCAMFCGIVGSCYLSLSTVKNKTTFLNG